jgi:hypothetical protein
MSRLNALRLFVDGESLRVVGLRVLMLISIASFRGAFFALIPQAVVLQLPSLS